MYSGLVIDTDSKTFLKSIMNTVQALIDTRIRESLYYRHEREQSFLGPVTTETNFRAGHSQKYFGHSPGPVQKKFWSRSWSKKEIWSRDRDHFAHLYYISSVVIRCYRDDRSFWATYCIST
jgi:hypothetical protein